MKSTQHLQSGVVTQLMCALLFGLCFAMPAQAQVFLTATDDANTSNDTSRGPTTTNDRADFIEIRNFQQADPLTTRKKIGYFKYDITGVDPQLYQFATLAGAFSGGRDGNGTFTVYGLNDGEMNLDDVPAGTFTEASWTESTLTYAMGLGVDVTVPTTTLGDLGIDPTETTLLGTITLVDGQPMQSNVIDLPLASFLTSDTNGVVTFLIADISSQTEWRMVAREASATDSVRLSFFPKAGDTDLDGVVELEDFDPIRTNYRLTSAEYSDGDLSGNGIVDFADFRIWKTGYLNGGTGSLSGADLGFLSSPVPEPGTLCFALVASLGLFCRQRGIRGV